MRRQIVHVARAAMAAAIAIPLLATPVSAQTSESCAWTAERGWSWHITFTGAVGGTGEVVSVFSGYAAGDLVVTTSRMLSGPDITYTFYVDNVAVGETEVPGSLSAVIPTSGRHSLGVGTPSAFDGEVEVFIACYSEEGLETVIAECVSSNGLATALRNHIGSGRAFTTLVDAQAGRQISEECAERLRTAAGHLFGSG